jgi:hypothetical protein
MQRSDIRSSTIDDVSTVVKAIVKEPIREAVKEVLSEELDQTRTETQSLAEPEQQGRRSMSRRRRRTLGVTALMTALAFLIRRRKQLLMATPFGDKSSPDATTEKSYDQSEREAPSEKMSEQDI